MCCKLLRHCRGIFTGQRTQAHRECCSGLGKAPQHQGQHLVRLGDVAARQHGGEQKLVEALDVLGQPSDHCGIDGGHRLRKSRSDDLQSCDLRVDAGSNLLLRSWLVHEPRDPVDHGGEFVGILLNAGRRDSQFGVVRDALDGNIRSRRSDEGQHKRKRDGQVQLGRKRYPLRNHGRLKRLERFAC
jgi:hypothetical protein